MNSQLAEILITSLMIVLEGILWLAAGEIPPESAAYPKGLIIMAFAISAIYLVMCIYKIKKQGLAKKEKEQCPGAGVQTIVFGVMVCIYIGLLEKVGYLIMTPVFIVASLWFLGMRKKITLLLVPVIVTGFTYFVFNYVLYVFLPAGILR